MPRPPARAPAVSFRAAAFAIALWSFAACGAKESPPHHPVGAMRARVEAKLDLVELVVKDPDRGARAPERRRVPKARSHPLSSTGDERNPCSGWHSQPPS